MPKYSYRAQDAQGRPQRGEAAAASEAELQRNLHEQGLLLLSAEEQETEKLSSRVLKGSQLADFSRQMGTLLGSGVSMVRALSILTQQETLKKYERRVYEQLLRSVRQGVPLSDSMEAAGGAFPDLLINMYRSAEAAGNLDQVAMRMAAHYDKQWRLTRKVKNALAYPRLLFVLLVAVVAVIMGYVMPQFSELFSQMESLPPATTFLLGVSSLVSNHWAALLGGLAALVLAVRVLSRIPPIRYGLDRLAVRLPGLGTLRKTVLTARFARALASLYSSGLPILSCLAIARRTLGNTYVDAQFDGVLDRVRAGQNLSDALAPVDGLLKKMEFSVRVGEETGKLDSMLDSAADALEFESETAINRAVTYLEPAMIILMAVLVGFVMIAVITPIYSGYDALGASY